jgi:hypothetical protein
MYGGVLAAVGEKSNVSADGIVGFFNDVVLYYGMCG